ncbi:hypothetical protein Tco_0853676 [Tanacetum coccineum]
MCEEFKDFNYLLKIDLDLLTKDIEGFKTYEEFKDDWIYEWNNDVQWREDEYCNGGNLPRAYIIGNSLHYQDYEWYEALEDGELKEEALRNKAIMEETIDKMMSPKLDAKIDVNVYDDTNHDREYEMDHEVDERQEICSNETYELSVCNIRRFKMIKYSFGDDEEYVAVKEDEYDDLTIIMEYLVKISKKTRILELKRRHLKITVLTSYTPFLALGWLLEGIQVTWAHLEKKQTRLQLYTKSLKKLCIQSLETESRVSSDGVRMFEVTATEIM